MVICKEVIIKAIINNQKLTKSVGILMPSVCTKKPPALSPSPVKIASNLLNQTNKILLQCMFQTNSHWAPANVSFSVGTLQTFQIYKRDIAKFSEMSSRPSNEIATRTDIHAQVIYSRTNSDKFKLQIHVCTCI